MRFINNLYPSFTLFNVYVPIRIFILKILIKKLYINLLDDTIYPTPPFGQDRTQGQFLSGV